MILLQIAFGGGGGRANFLASIQKGATLKKVEPKSL